MSCNVWSGLGRVCAGLWAVVLLLIPGSSFSTLLDYFGPTSWMFYGRQPHCSLSSLPPSLPPICPLLDR